MVRAKNISWVGMEMAGEKKLERDKGRKAIHVRNEASWKLRGRCKPRLWERARDGTWERRALLMTTSEGTSSLFDPRRAVQ